MYRVGVFGNNRLAISVVEQIKTNDDMELIVIIPEGKDLICSKKQISHDEGYWENSFLNYAKNCRIGKLYVGNVNDFDVKLDKLNLDILFDVTP